MSHALYQFSSGELRPIDWCDPRAGETLVADSWLVRDGRVVALDQHLERFRTSVGATTALEETAVEAFLRSVLHQLEGSGLWFPRIEAVATPGGPILRYRHRSAPEITSQVILATTADDPRKTPLVKGPDLDALLRLRSSVTPLGASEAIMVDNLGAVVEGAYSTIVAWLGDQEAIAIVPRSTPRLPSITEHVVEEIAQQQGIPVYETTLRPEALENATVWVLSALHGIRQATRWIKGPVLNPDLTRRDRWQRLWQERAQPVGESEAF